MGWKTVAEWAQAIEDIPDDQYGWLEWHANEFAGLILVPDAHLSAQVEQCERTIKAILKDSPEPEALQEFKEFLAKCIGRAFHVSPPVASRRIARLREG